MRPRTQSATIPLAVCFLYLALCGGLAIYTKSRAFALITLPPGCVTLTAVLVWASFHRGLNRRIDEMVRATERIAAGESLGNASIPHSAELGKLAVAFQQMSEKISSSKAELLEANERMKAEIAERKAVEEALRNSERRFRSIWENSLEPLRLTDEHGVVVAANPAYCKLMEKSRRKFWRSLTPRFTNPIQRRTSSAAITKCSRRARTSDTKPNG